MAYSVGDRVTQAQYGPGTITGINEFHTVIDFDEHGVHTFSTPLVVLQRTTTPAPVKATKTRRRAPRADVAKA